MIKKIFFVFIFFISSQCCYALTKEDVNIEFFNRFNDDCLMYYINTAFENNHDLKQTAAKVEQYRQQTKYSLGGELPSLSVSPSYIGVHVPQFDNFQLRKNGFALPFIASYEADFLLKNRDKTRSAEKNYEAAAYEEKSVYISLFSDIATIYTNILQYDYLIENQKRDISANQKILSADGKKFKSGVINSAQLNKSIQNLENSKNKYEKLMKEQESLLRELAVLCAISPDCIDDMQRGNLNAFEYNCAVPDEISSDVIFSRPDVLEAEAKLEKAKIDTRVAKKEFFPTINITGIWAFNTISPGTFFSWESSLASILAGATQDIFQGGKKVANLRMQKAKYTELFEDYCQTNLEALKEVSNALSVIKHDTQADFNTVNKLNYEIKSFGDTQKKTQRGVISNPEYYREELSLINAQNEAAQSKSQRLVNYFTLYKAVGGQL